MSIIFAVWRTDRERRSFKSRSSFALSIRLPPMFRNFPLHSRCSLAKYPTRRDRAVRPAVGR